jgi:hypothetical protein
MSGSQFNFPKKGYSIAEYSTPGAHSFVVPSGVKEISAIVVGAGGGGGGHTLHYGGGGGGIVQSYLKVTPGETVSIFVGTGGAGGNAFGSGPSSGQDSTLSTTLNILRAKGGLRGGLISASAGGEGSNPDGVAGGDRGASLSVQPDPGGNSIYNTGGAPGLTNVNNFFGGSGGGASYGKGGAGGDGAIGGNPPEDGFPGERGGGGGGSGNNKSGGQGGNGYVVVYYNSGL